MAHYDLISWPRILSDDTKNRTICVEEKVQNLVLVIFFPQYFLTYILLQAFFINRLCNFKLISDITCSKHVMFDVCTLFLEGSKF